MKRGLKLSIIFNILFVIIFGGMYYKKIGFFDIRNKINAIFYKEKVAFVPYYYEKIDQFKNYSSNSNSIIFVGDSITDMCDWKELFHNNNILNMGIGGDNIEGVLNRTDLIIKYKPSKVFIMVGTNDLSGKESIQILINNYEKIVLQIKQNSPNTKIYVQSVLPVNASVWKKSTEVSFYKRKEDNNQIIQFNKLLENMANKNNLFYIDLYNSFTDNSGNLNLKYSVSGLHLNEQGYLLWKEKIQQYIQ